MIVAKAAGAAPGSAVLHLHPRNTGAHAIGAPPSLDGTDRLEVPLVRVDDELERLGAAPERAAVLWGDVEGDAPQVLDAPAGLLARPEPVAFQFHPGPSTAAGQA